MSERICLCGCGASLGDLRADAVYASEACSKRARRAASPDKGRTGRKTDTDKLVELLLQNPSGVHTHDLRRRGISGNPSQRATDAEEKYGIKIERTRESRNGRPGSRFTLIGEGESPAGVGGMARPSREARGVGRSPLADAGSPEPCPRSSTEEQRTSKPMVAGSNPAGGSQARGVTRTINKSSTPVTKANPKRADARAATPEAPGGESGVPAAPEPLSLLPETPYERMRDEAA